MLFFINKPMVPPTSTAAVLTIVPIMNENINFEFTKVTILRKIFVTSNVNRKFIILIILDSMNSFLYRVAKAFNTAYQDEISRIMFVFPNRRAGLFFQRYLSQVVGKSIFSPGILTINDCFNAACNWQPADRLSMHLRL